MGGIDTQGLDDLDYQVAEKVFGWQLCVDASGGDTVYWSVPEGDPARDAFGSADRPPLYSTDVAAAMTAFERMVERIGAGGINLDMEDARGQGHIYHVWIGDSAGVSGPLPEAICRAALAAVTDATPA